MRRSVLCLTVLVLLAACENSANPLAGTFGGGGAITPTQVTGNWSFTLQRTTTLPCTSAPLASGTLIRSRIDVRSDGTLVSTSSWVNPLSGAVLPLSGQVRLTDAFADLFLAASGNGQMELRGTMTSAGGFTGTLTDPAPGFAQVFGTGGCEYTATGTKTG